MKLRTRLDLFSTALLSALGATQVVACGGSAQLTGGDPDGTGSPAGAGAGNEGGSVASGGRSNVAGSGTSSAGAPGPGAAGAVGSGGGGAQHPCTNPQDLGNGFVQCDGFKHRRKEATCTSRVPRPDPVPTLDGTAMCKFDSDCKEKPYGWCTDGAQTGTPYCAYGCVQDSDCGTNQICECGEPIGRCLAASCVSDVDCGAGYLCRGYDTSGGCGPLVYACQTPADSCGNDADCNPSSGRLCRIGVGQTFQCMPGICAIGRPFLVQGAERRAPAATRSDWHELALLPSPTELDATLSIHLAERWTLVALMEHASIAAFARFTLQLMSLGAPASLIERATAAMVDETKHAKACFAVASRFAVRPLGPGRLAIERSLDESSLQEIVLNTIREGCVGETVAAIEAREAAEHTSDPALRQLLLVISEDETRHAELAYCFVKWALAQGGRELELAVQREFAALAGQTSPAPSPLTDRDDALLRHGIVPDMMRQAIRAQAFTEVILPCSRALFATEAQSSQRPSASV